MSKSRKFHRVRNQRKALLESLAVALIMKGKIKTTLARAKELKSVIERYVTYAKKKSPEIRRFLPKAAALKLLKEIAPKYQERKGGYIRIIKLPPRAGDAAKMAIVEFV